MKVSFCDEMLKVLDCEIIVELVNSALSFDYLLISNLL